MSMRVLLPRSVRVEGRRSSAAGRARLRLRARREQAAEPGEVYRESDVETAVRPERHEHGIDGVMSVTRPPKRRTRAIVAARPHDRSKTDGGYFRRGNQATGYHGRTSDPA